MASLFTYSGKEYLNIDATVGTDGVNNPDDVCLVAAILHEVLKYNYGSPTFAVKPSPSLTGTFNSEIKDALAEYKKLSGERAANAKSNSNSYQIVRNNKVYFKNHINPIRGSIYAFGKNVLWTMARLNEELVLNSINGSFDTVEGLMFHKYPILKKIIK